MWTQVISLFSLYQNLHRGSNKDYTSGYQTLESHILIKKPTGSPLETLSEENSWTANFGHVNSKLKTDFPFRGNGDASPEVSKEKHFQQKSNVESLFP